MKVRTLRIIFKEGLINAFRNKLMSFASVVIVVATLVIFGFFLLIAMNFELNLSIVKDQPLLIVFCDPALDNTQVDNVEKIIKMNPKISEYTVTTKKQALQEMKVRLAEDASILNGISEEILPVSFSIKLKNPAQSTVVVDYLKKINGVQKVSYSQKVIDVISKVTYWIKFISGGMIIVLLVISVFIISNTIKLTVFARRKEINIMKYIGATDWFIRWPFIVEGVIIGITGALIAFILTAYGYDAIEAKFNQDLLTISSEFFKLIKIRDVWFQVSVSYAAIGIFVGSLGSILSIRRYLKV